MNEKINKKIKECFVIEMSNKRKIQIDGDEIPKVLNSIESGSVAWLRQGLFNPSFFIDLVFDDERYQKRRAIINEIEKHNKHDLEYSEGGDQRGYPEVKKLEDIFSDIKALSGGMKMLSEKK